MFGRFVLLIDTRLIVTTHRYGVPVCGRSVAVSDGVTVGGRQNSFGDSRMCHEHGDRKNGDRVRKPSSD